MAETTSIKLQAGKNAEQSDKRLRDPVRQPALSGGAAQILALQKTIGNQAVSQLLQSGTGEMPAIQTKLMINQPGDKYEQEADRIAELVTKPDSQMNPGLSTGRPQHISRKCSACASGQKTCSQCADEEIQRKPTTPNITPLIQRQSHGDDKEEPSTSPEINHTPGHTPPATTEVQSHIQSLRTGGQPLPGTSRAFFESRLHYDFGQVRTHTGPQADQAARAVNARAFTIGRDVVFASGQYAPDTNEGQRLLAHELTHVVQQTPPSSPASSTIQRQAASTAPTAGATPNRNEEATTAGMIVEDTATDLLPGQMKKTEFLAELRAEVCRAAEAVLAKTGRTTEDCPYLNFWFDFYGQKESRHIEGAIHKYEPETSGVTTASAYIPLIVGRVRRGVEVWAKTGQITGIPEDMATGASMPRSSESGGDSTPAKGSIQFKAHNGGARGGSNPQAIKTQLGYGSPLDGGVRSRMESAYGRSFSHVRVHTDTTATALSGGLNARAFTVGEHIAFGSSEYRPGSLIGDAIIAHELAHVIQQESASNVIAPAQMGQGSYDQFEEDADQSAVAAAISLWGRTKRVLNGIQNIKPRLKSGLQLQACRRTVRQCPRGLRWAVVGQPTATGPVCVCVWRCLPPGQGFSLSSGSGGSSGPSISCANKDLYGRCPGEPNYETVDEDYEKRNEGTKIGVGAHMSPLGEQAACGCLPLDIEGDPTGEKQVHAPLLAPGLDITDLGGMKGRSRRTGEIQPGKEPSKTKPTVKPTVKPTETTETKPTVKPTETTETKPTVKPAETTETKPTVKPAETTETKPTVKPAETTETKPTETKPTAPVKTEQQVAAEKLSDLQAQRSSKQAELEQLQQRTRDLEKQRTQAENERKAASSEYDKATTREAKDQALAKLRDAKARRDARTAELDKLPSDDGLKREVKKLDSQIEAELPKPTQGKGRDPLDVEVEKNNPKPPPAKATGKIGESPAQDAEMQKDIASAKSQGATDIRVNQEQVNAQGKRVGVNRPDLQYTLPDGTRVYIEYDTTTSGRGPGHKKRILDNDPKGKVDLKIID